MFSLLGDGERDLTGLGDALKNGDNAGTEVKLGDSSGLLLVGFARRSDFAQGPIDLCSDTAERTGDGALEEDPDRSSCRPSA